jgi:hypothetical protein
MTINLMKISPSFNHSVVVLAVLLLNSAAGRAVAQVASSAPVGYIVQTIPAGQSRSFSVPLDAPASSQANSVGRLTGVGENWFDNSDAKWTAGAFSSVEAPYFIRLTSGAQTGRLFRISNPANTANRVYVADDGLTLLDLNIEVGPNGARYEIIPADTLATLLGTAADSSLVLQGADDPLIADLVQIWGGASWINFYFNTDWGRWARDRDGVASPSRNNFLLRPDRGVMITRRGSTPLEIAVVGRVAVTPPRLVHTRTPNAFTFLATMQATDITLGELALQNVSRSQDWLGASTPDEADLVVVWDGDSWFSYYYNTTNNHWQRVDELGTDRDGYVIKAGTPVFVQRRQAGLTSAERTLRFPSIGG